MPHNGEVYSVTFSPNGNYIALEGCDKYDENRACIQGSAQVWDANTGKEIAHMIHEGWVRAIAFSPNGNYIVSGSEDKTARVWETSTGREIARMTYDDWVSSVGFSPDGKMLFQEVPMVLLMFGMQPLAKKSLV
ncbi:MAG: hypothetical protein IPP55_20115 [Anaerolineales bacterium]|nr:hypothetical protein [Anaerolineales bacterium]